jgi:hypothetical protein
MPTTDPLTPPNTIDPRSGEPYEPPAVVAVTSLARPMILNVASPPSG